jgi:maltodextrin utilization protein YvdJ
MKKLNKEKYFSIFIVLTVLSPVLFSFQNFKHYDVPLAIDKDDTAINDALIAALKNAEDERRAKQVALNVDPSQTDEKSVKRNRKPATIGERHIYDTEGKEVPLTEDSLASDSDAR